MKTLATLAMVLAAIFPAAPAMAQQPGGLHRQMSSQIESGWTSNAERQAGGRPDVYLTHQHSLTISGAGAGLALRGSVNFSETRFLRLGAENDASAGLDFSGEVALGSGALRGSLGISHLEEGRTIGPAGAGLGSTTPHWAGRAGLELTRQFGPTGLVVGADYQHNHYGETRFSGVALSPQRSKAHIGLLSLYAVTTQALDENLSLSARARLQHGFIAAADRAAYGRVAATALRLNAGIAAALPLRAGFLLEGGVDIVMPDLAGPGTIILPYGLARMELALNEQLTLDTGFATDTRMSDPLDGLAEWVIEGQAGATWRFSPTLGARAAVFAAETRSVGFDIGTERNFGGELSVETALAAAATLGGTLRHKHVSGLAPDYEETRLTLNLRAAL